jgi:type IV pilus assembly protein PilN
MIRINLLGDHKVRGSGENRWLLKGFSLALVLVLFTGLLVYWLLGLQVNRLKKEKTALQRQAQAYPVLLQEIKELKEKKEIARKRLTLLQTLEKERHGPVRLMEQLSVLLPINQLWITTLKETGPELRLDGMALSNEVLAEYLKRLESIPLIHQVDLVQSNQVTYKELKVKQFSITAWLKPPDKTPEGPK